MKIDIVIPTHNPTKKLIRTVFSIQKQLTDENILIVENGSDLAYSTLKQNRSHLRYLQSELGANNARNFGWQNSDADYILFTDDDTQLTESYLQNLRFLLGKYKPDLIGGKVSLVDKPKWLVGHAARTLAEVQYENKIPGANPEAFLLSRERTEYIVGANMICKRSWLEGIGGFDPALGYKGNLIANDELYVLDMAHLFLYSPMIHVLHHCQERYNHEYLIKRSYGQGIADCIYFSNLCRDKDIFIETHLAGCIGYDIRVQINEGRNLIKDEDLTKSFIELIIRMKKEYQQGFWDHFEKLEWK